jgi:hypothetical protein
MTPKMLKIIPFVAIIALVGCGDSGTAPLTETIDTVPPAVPANVELQAWLGVEKALVVTWESNAEPDLAGYIVQRSLDDEDTWETVTGVLTTNEWHDGYHSLAHYRVSAVDLSENQSAFSGSVGYLAGNGLPKWPQIKDPQEL